MVVGGNFLTSLEEICLQKEVGVFINAPPSHFSLLVFIQDMTKDQIANEKVALQKALLYYESIHGRPVRD